MRVLKNVVRWLLLALGISILIFAIWLQGQYVVPVLMYHHVENTSIKELNTVTPKDFERQMKFLKKYDYNVISVQEYIQAKREGIKLSRKTVVITFDDGFQDNYINAFPILKKLEFPAMIFVITDMIGRQNFLSWPQIYEMEKSGVMIGSHTRRHAYLPNVPEGLVQEEVQGSKEILEKKLGHKIDFIAYPSGGFSLGVKRIVREAGYLAGFTTNRGQDKQNNDLYEIKRIRMNSADSWIVMYAKFSGYYNVFRKTKRSHSDDDTLGISSQDTK